VYTLSLVIVGGRIIRCRGTIVWINGEHAGFRISDDLGYGRELAAFIQDLCAAYHLIDRINRDDEGALSFHSTDRRERAFPPRTPNQSESTERAVDC